MENKLLILDLDETLLYATVQSLDRSADFIVGEYSVYKRPHVDGFLVQCFEWYRVAVWTSASPDYAAGVVAALFPQRPVFVWASDRCTPLCDPETGEYCLAKNLKKVKQCGYALENVIVVDDSPEKHTRNFGNLIHVAPYQGQETDSELPLLLQYLARLRTVSNVRTVEKRRWRFEAKSKGNNP